MNRAMIALALPQLEALVTQFEQKPDVPADVKTHARALIDALKRWLAEGGLHG
jgi:hypothetical protein